MDGLGFIRDTLDIELLILFILNRLPGGIDRDTLSELTMLDGGINYFTFSEALSDLVETGHVIEQEGLFSSTEKGKRNGAETESSLPYSVRLKAERSLQPIVQRLRRSEMIRAEHHPGKNGGIVVHLSLSDGSGDMLAMDILTGSEWQARGMEAHFRAHAEALYTQIAALLTPPEQT